MDQVTLLAEDGTAIGSRAKSEVHTTDTPLHLAFSCYVFDTRGRLLVTRRALGKRTWPGVWTNSFCGHPRPEEPMSTAVRRHGLHELGLQLTELREVISDYRYRAIDASGIVENEVCPVHVALVDGDPTADPDEVSEWAWIDPDELVEAVARAPFAFSPWMVEQLPRLRTLGEV